MSHTIPSQLQHPTPHTNHAHIPITSISSGKIFIFLFNELFTKYIFKKLLYHTSKTPSSSCLLSMNNSTCMNFISILNSMPNTSVIWWYINITIHYYKVKEVQSTLLSERCLSTRYKVWGHYANRWTVQNYLILYTFHVFVPSMSGYNGVAETIIWYWPNLPPWF